MGGRGSRAGKAKPGTRKPRVTQHAPVPAPDSAKPTGAKPASAKPAGAKPAGALIDVLMRRAGQPGGILVFLLLAFIIVAGWRAPQYVVDPTTLPGPQREVAAVVLAAFAFLAFSTLNVAAYCLIVAMKSELTRKFIAAVANRAAIGAILGTLLGLRLAPMMVPPNNGSQQAQPVTFIGFEGNLSNTITLFTLILVATAWPYCAGPVMEAAAEILSSGLSWLKSLEGALRVPLALLMLVSSNFLGFALAGAVYAGVAQTASAWRQRWWWSLIVVLLVVALEWLPPLLGRLIDRHRPTSWNRTATT